jgi:uncharacterized protein (DUF58 family)
MSSRTAGILRSVRSAVPSWRGSLRTPRRVDSPFAGLHKTGKIGPGEEWSDAKNYQPGDDVRRIDWPATARSGEVQVRSTLADRGLRLTLVVDCSPSMQFGTDTLTKADLALATAAAVSLVAARQGDSVAAMLVKPDGNLWIEPGSGVSHINVLLKTLEHSFSTEGPASFTNGLHRAGANTLSSGMFVVISDFFDEGIGPVLRTISSKHRTLAIVVEDSREFKLVPAGLVEVFDPETEEYFLFDSDSKSFAQRFAALADTRRQFREELLRSSGAEVHKLVCGPDWLQDLSKVVSRGTK